MQIFSLVLVECGWNKSWIPAELPACTSKACPDIPFPPKKIGLEYSPDERNNMTLISGKHSMKYLDLPPPQKKKKIGYPNNRHKCRKGYIHRVTGI